MLIVALVLAAAAEAAPARPELRPSGQCTLVAVEAISTPAARPAAAARGPIEVFPASSTLDLALRTTLVPAAAGRAVRFRVYTPNGHLYQELRAEAESVSKLTVGARLPVAGTDVVNHSLYGTWTVSAHVDTAAQPCSRSRAFSLAP